MQDIPYIEVADGTIRQLKLRRINLAEFIDFKNMHFSRLANSGWIIDVDALWFFTQTSNPIISIDNYIRIHGQLIYEDEYYQAMRHPLPPVMGSFTGSVNFEFMDSDKLDIIGIAGRFSFQIDPDDSPLMPSTIVLRNCAGHLHMQTGKRKSGVRLVFSQSYIRIVNIDSDYYCTSLSILDSVADIGGRSGLPRIAYINASNSFLCYNYSSIATLIDMLRTGMITLDDSIVQMTIPHTADSYLVKALITTAANARLYCYWVPPKLVLSVNPFHSSSLA